jgi:hypothetical protein
MEFVKHIMGERYSGPVKLFPNKMGVNDLGWPMDAFGLELGGGIRTFGVPIETIKISGSRLNPRHHTIVVAPRDFSGHDSLFRRKNMDLHPVNQGSPEEESACVSSQVGSSQTTCKIHCDFLPRRSETTRNIEARAMAR